MATMGPSQTFLRIVLGLAGEEAQIWDIDVGAIKRGGACPSAPAYRVSAKAYNNTSDPNNLNTVFEGVDISADGLTVALGAEGKNAVALLLMPSSILGREQFLGGR